MSAQWPPVGADTTSRPAPPLGAIQQANGVVPTTFSPQQAAQLQARILAAQAASNGTDLSKVAMSNGVIAPSALATPVAAMNPLNLQQGGPPLGVNPHAATMNQNGKRELSPDRSAGMPPLKTIKSAHGEDVKPVLPSPPTPAIATPMVATPVIATPTPLAPTTVPGPAPVAAPGPTPAPPPVARPTPAAVAPSAAPVAPAAAAAAAPTIPATPVTPAAHPAPVAAVKLEPVVPTPAAPPKSKKKKKPQEKKEDDKEEGKGKDKDKEEKDASGAASGSAQPGGLLPMGRGQGIDLRAEEEAQRRAFRSAVGNTKFAGNASRARHTDLFGEPKLRKRLNEIAEKHGMAFDDEAMRYLALAAEIRVRSLVSSAVRAQHHRVASTHQHKPPMSKGSSSKPAQPLWSQKITSDPHAVMAALANANREENKAHRVARTERNARETEIARAEAARDRERDRDGGSQSNEPAAATTSGGPASESDGPSPSPSATKPKEPTFQAAPTFGQPPPTKKGGKSKKAATRDVSADMQQKMMNATALLQAGGRKRYAWETGAMSGAFKPQVPSLLSGKRKKGAGKDDEQAGGAAGGQDGAAGGSGKGGAGAGAGAAGADWADADMAPRPPKRPKRAVTGPHRRPVDLETPGDKKGRDDTALTAVDMLFALEHEGSGRGMGTADEIVARVNARPGGPYGRW